MGRIQLAERPQPAPGQIWQVLPDGRWAFWFDSHTVSDFTKCETFFYNKEVSVAPLQLRLKGQQRACITIGSWWSKVSELFYKRVARWQANRADDYTMQLTPKPTIHDMMLIAAQAWVSEGMDALEKADPDKYEKFAIPVRAGAFGKYFGEASNFSDVFLEQYANKAKSLRTLAKDSEDPDTKNRLEEEARELEAKTILPLGALLMAAQYYDNFAEQDMRNWRVIAAESHFGSVGEVPIGETDKVVVFWQGRPDLVVYEPSTNLLCPLDQKTKEHIPWNVQQIWKPHNQMAGYIYSIRHIAHELGYDNALVDRAVISVCARLQPSTPRKKGAAPKPRFVRVRPTWTADELEEWRVGILYKAERMRDVLTNNSYTRNEFQCHIYSGCEFRGICSRPAGVRPIVIQSDFTAADPWSPFDDPDDD